MISEGPSVLHLARFVNGFPFKPGELGAEGLPVVRIKHLLDESAEPERALAPERAVLIDDGDLIFSWSATLAVRRWHRGQALLNQHLFRVDPMGAVDARWLHYILEVGIDRLRPMMHGSAMTHITKDMLRQVRVRKPELSAQVALADQLDTKTARIDAIIAKKQELKERLLERRKALTYAAVQGDSSIGEVERRDSEIPWVTSIPEHWRETPLTLVAKLGTGHTPSRERPDWWTDCRIPWMTTGEVAQMRSDQIEFISETRESISDLGLANSSAELHPAGTVALSRTASAGFSAIMGRAMATSQDFVVWTCGPLLEPRFLLLCLRAMRGDLLNRLAQGSTHKTIYMPDIKSISIPLPPVEEQREIAERAWGELRRIDEVVERLERQVELLREHRQSLVTAAVTCELKTPGVAP